MGTWGSWIGCLWVRIVSINTIFLDLSQFWQHNLLASQIPICQATNTCADNVTLAFSMSHNCCQSGSSGSSCSIEACIKVVFIAPNHSIWQWRDLGSLNRCILSIKIGRRASINSSLLGVAHLQRRWLFDLSLTNGSQMPHAPNARAPPYRA